jgi:charged multivesicular body protein 7
LYFDYQNRVLLNALFKIPKSAVPPKKHPWISEGDDYVITAYFVDPSTICNGKRPYSKYIGDRLLIQTGSSSTSVMKIPYKQGDLSGTGWVEGKCFYLMGE